MASSVSAPQQLALPWPGRATNPISLKAASSWMCSCLWTPSCICLVDGSAQSACNWGGLKPAGAAKHCQGGCQEDSPKLCGADFGMQLPILTEGIAGKPIRAEAVLSGVTFAVCGMDWFNWEKPWRSLYYCFSEWSTDCWSKGKSFFCFQEKGVLIMIAQPSGYCVVTASRKHKGWN